MSNNVENNIAGSAKYAANHAASLFQCLRTAFPLNEIKDTFQAMGHEDCVEFEAEHAYFIQKFIRAPAMSNERYLNLVGRDSDPESVGLLLLFTVIAMLRVQALLELQIQLSKVLNPNSRSKVICERTYEFGQIAARLQLYEWPEAHLDARVKDPDLQPRV